MIATHARHEMLGTQEMSVQVDREPAAPCRIVQLVDGAFFHVRSVVHHNVAAPEARIDFACYAMPVLILGDICTQLERNGATDPIGGAGYNRNPAFMSLEGHGLGSSDLA